MATEQRLIDASELTDRLNHTTMVAYPNLFPGLLAAVEIVDDSPTVDAVEVVRCKDCEKWKCHGMPFDITKGTCYNPRFHFHHGHVLNECFMPVTNETDFCSYGERRAT